LINAKQNVIQLDKLKHKVKVTVIYKMHLKLDTTTVLI